jgi:hypothetical protein
VGGSRDLQAGKLKLNEIRPIGRPATATNPRLRWATTV